MLRNLFLSAMVSILSYEVAAQKAISKDCLILSDTTAGQQTGKAFSNVNELIAEPFTDEWRLTKIKFCSDKRDDVTGIQFVLGAEGQSEVRLGSAGDVKGGCTMYQLPGPVTTIKASSNSRGSGVNNFKLKAGENEVLIDGSKLAKEYKQWWFEEMPLIGLYGRQNEGVD